MKILSMLSIWLRLEYYRAAQRHLHPLHPDVPHITMQAASLQHQLDHHP